MTKRIALVCITAFLLFLAACAYESNNYTSPAETPPIQCPREILAEMGWTEDMLESLAEGGISYQNIINQSHFSGYIDDIYNNRPIGPSGEIIAPRYNGGIYFNDDGVLTIMVLGAAFHHPSSATAIEEMRELGIIVRIAEFTHADLIAEQDKLNQIWQQARGVGLTSSGIGATNRITIWLDPYNNEQKEIFTNFLLDNSINPAMFIIEPAVTDEMRDFRATRIAEALTNPCGRIVPVGSVDVSRTEIAFSLQNVTTYEFSYGAPWDLAFYSNGNWLPVTHLPGAGGSGWPAIGFSLQGGGIKNYRQNFEWHFGELLPGRYMFIRDGWLGEWSMDRDSVYALVEFIVTENCPVSLPPAEEVTWESIINVIDYSSITSTGMRLVIENISAYDIDHRAQIISIVHERYAVSEYYWEWQSLPFLLVEGYWTDYLMQGEGLLPSGGQLEILLDWTAVFGELEPGEYRMVLSLGGRAHPPHPTGWAFGDTAIVEFVIE